MQISLPFRINVNSFSDLNDEYGYTFPMIADVIESLFSDNPVNINDHDTIIEFAAKYKTNA
jgi:predicted nucleic-acid-binding protein